MVYEYKTKEEKENKGTKEEKGTRENGERERVEEGGRLFRVGFFNCGHVQNLIPLR